MVARDVELWHFVSSSRVSLQAIVEYYGPRLPLERLVHSAYALELPNQSTFIDGNHDNWKSKNLIAIHELCHNYIHMGKSSQS